MFSPKFLRERRKSFVHRVFSIRSITLGHGKVLAFIWGLKLAPTSNDRAKVAELWEVCLVRNLSCMLYFDLNPRNTQKLNALAMRYIH